MNFLALDPDRLLRDRCGDEQIAKRNAEGFRTPKSVVLKYPEAAEELSIPLDELMRLTETGELRTTRITRRQRGISLTEISRYRSAQFARLPASKAREIELLLSLPLNPKK